jgi:muramoyltetrapeptide carboxypeptidase
MRLREGVEALRRRGFRVRLGPTLREAHRRGHFSAPDAMRAKELVDAFRDPEVDAVFCARGGVGALRVLPLLDYEAFRQHPKPFVGFSDITAYQAAFFERAGLVTVQGPMVAVYPEVPDESSARRIYDETWDRLFRVVTDGETPVLENPPDAPDPKTVRPGRAEGILVGGNLTLFQALQGTEFEVTTRDRLLFLEDVDMGSEQYEDALAALSLAGKLRDALGIAVGELLEPKAREPLTQGLEETVTDALAADGASAPAFLNFASGHGRHFLPLPIGGRMRLDADEGTLAFLEPAVER